MEIVLFIIPPPKEKGRTFFVKKLRSRVFQLCYFDFPVFPKCPCQNTWTLVPNPLENCWVLQHPCWILDSSTWLWSSSFSGNCKRCIMHPHFSVLDQAEIELCGHLILQFGPKICKILQKIVLRGTYVGYPTLLHAYVSVVFQGIKNEASSFLCTKTWPMLWNALEEAKIEPWGPLVFMLSFWGECHLKWCVTVQDSPGVVLNIHMSIAAFSGQYHVALGTSLDVVIWVQRKQLLGSIWFKES